jgi:hypothetical protein
MRAYPIQYSVIEGARAGVRQILLCWFFGFVLALAVWHKDAFSEPYAWLTAIPIGLIAAIPLWVFFRVVRFAIGR